MTRRRDTTLKDKVLNARIPEELDRELRAQAERLDVPVSQLVRNILQRTVDLVGNFSGNVEHLITDVVEDVAGFRACALGEGERSALEKRIARVLAWQTVRLQQPARCAWSASRLDVGDEACLGILDDGSPSVILGPQALEAVLAQRTPQELWVPVRLNRSATCAETGAVIDEGAEAYIRPGTKPLQVLSVEGHRRRTDEPQGAS